jgi:hypothetical protein
MENIDQNKVYRKAGSSTKVTNQQSLSGSKSLHILELLDGDDKINEETSLRDKVDELTRRLERTEK